MEETMDEAIRLPLGTWSAVRLQARKGVQIVLTALVGAILLSAVCVAALQDRNVLLTVRLRLAYLLHTMALLFVGTGGSYAMLTFLIGAIASTAMKRYWAAACCLTSFAIIYGARALVEPPFEVGRFT